jgi:hypothetical protein
MPRSPFFAETSPEYTDAALLSHVNDLRDRAEELLVRAETFHDAGARKMMLTIAWNYEKMARRLETRFGAPGKA